jgi:hypothetical protein
VASRPASQPRPKAKKRAPAPKGRRPAATKKKPAKRSSLDMFHLLAVAAGAFSGLALYAVITPGQMPDEAAEVAKFRPDPRMALQLSQLKGGRRADGFMHVTGALVNGRDQTCRLASVTIRFFDTSGQQVADTLATVERIPGRARGEFAARAHAPGAVRFEVAVDMAQFEPARGRP